MYHFDSNKKVLVHKPAEPEPSDYNFFVLSNEVPGLTLLWKNVN
jgi:hypothetical protein